MYCFYMPDIQCLPTVLWNIVGICVGIQTCNSKFLECTKPLFDRSVFATEMFNTMLYIDIWMSKKIKIKHLQVAQNLWPIYN